jgi:WD40 repeat protein
MKMFGKNSLQAGFLWICGLQADLQLRQVSADLHPEIGVEKLGIGAICLIVADCRIRLGAVATAGYSCSCSVDRSGEGQALWRDSGGRLSLDSLYNGNMWGRSALVCLLLATSAFGTKVSVAPRPSLWLTTGAFLALDDEDSVTLYDQKGTTLRRFGASFISAIAVTSDEKFLLLACYDGQLKLFDIHTGATIWTKRPLDTGLRFVHDASFAWDGRSLIVCDEEGQAFIYDTTTGKQIGAVTFPPNRTRIRSAALSPDGSKGVLVDGSEHVFIFDTASGKLQDTGLKGAGPIRYSADGRYFSFSSENPGTYAQLRVAAADGKSSVDAGDFRCIGHIKPTADGKFLVSAMANPGSKAAAYLVVGAVCDPDNGKVAVVWKMPFRLDVQPLTDFDSQKMLGVCTDFHLITSVLDLKNSKTLMTIDNSGNFQRRLASIHSHARGGDYLIVLGMIVVAGVVGVVLVGVFRQRVRRAKVSGRRWA